MINQDNVVAMIQNACGDVSTTEGRSKILDLEDEIKSMPQIDLPVRHLFSGGIYAREIFMPKGTVLTGRMYLVDHIDFMVCGDMTVTTDNESKRLSGYNILPSSAGKKRAGYVHEDTLWITFCSVEEETEEYFLTHVAIEDSEKFEQSLLERRIIDESVIRRAFIAQRSYKETEYESFKRGYLASSGKLTKEEADRLDFELMAKDMGVTVEFIKKESEVTTNLVDIECDGVFLASSPISGTGLFTKNTYQPNDIIMFARVDGKRTMAGRYTNHSIRPNAVFVRHGDDLQLKASKLISNEEITLDYRESAKLGRVICQQQ